MPPWLAVTVPPCTCFVLPCRFLTDSIGEVSVNTGLSEAFIGM